MSNNNNKNWKYLTSLNLKIGDLVCVRYEEEIHRGLKASGMGHTTERKVDMCIVTELDLDNGYSQKEIKNKFNQHASLMFVKDQHNSKSYRYVGLHNPRLGSRQIYLFHPTYQHTWNERDLDHPSLGWTTPDMMRQKEKESNLRKKASAYIKNAKMDWKSKYGVMKEYNKYVEDLKANSPRYAGKKYQYDCACWCIEKEKEILYQKYSAVMCDLIDNRWDHNPKTLRGLIEDAIPLAEKEYINIDVRIGREQIQYDISFKHDQDYRYEFIDWDFDERDTEYNNIISNCPTNIKELVEEHYDMNPEEFWGTTEWYERNVKNSYHHTGRYEYRLTDPIE